MIWPFRRKHKAPQVLEAEPVPAPPQGEGWRPWFELSQRAAHDPPWNHPWVEIWRPNWDRPRATRSADIPYELNGPGFWWRPYVEPLESTANRALLIEGDAPLIENEPPAPAAPPRVRE